MNRRLVSKTVGTADTASLLGLAGCSNSNQGTNSKVSEARTGNTEMVADSETNTASDPTGQMVKAGGEYYLNPISRFIELETAAMGRVESGSYSSTAYGDGDERAAVTRIPVEAAAWNSGTHGEQGSRVGHAFERWSAYDYFCTSHKSPRAADHIVDGLIGDPAKGNTTPTGEVSYETLSG